MGETPSSRSAPSRAPIADTPTIDRRHVFIGTLRRWGPQGPTWAASPESTRTVRRGARYGPARPAQGEAVVGSAVRV